MNNNLEFDDLKDDKKTDIQELIIILINSMGFLIGMFLVVLLLNSIFSNFFDNLSIKDNIVIIENFDEI